MMNGVMEAYYSGLLITAKKKKRCAAMAKTFALATMIVNVKPLGA